MSKLSAVFTFTIAAVFTILGKISHAEAPGETFRGPASPTATSATYQLSPQDLVQIHVFQEEDLSTVQRLSDNGTIDLPLIGEVKLSGQSLQQAARTIENRLRPDYLIHPQVTVTIAEFVKKRITILGEVNKPGAYEIPANESIDLTQAIGLAGGYSRLASPARTTVKRAVGGREEVIKVNAKVMTNEGNTQRFRVLPGDTITVGKSYF